MLTEESGVLTMSLRDTSTPRSAGGERDTSRLGPRRAQATRFEQDPPADNATPRWAKFIDDRRLRLFGKDGTLLPDSCWERALLGPIRQILSRPGRGIHARLVKAGFSLVNPVASVPTAAVGLLEVLHAGSVILDDIENASTQPRGGPAIHETFGMPTTVNAGNWMHFAALDHIEHLQLDDTRSLALYRRVNQTMLDRHRGQALDLDLKVGDVRWPDLPAVVSQATLLKTASLTSLAPVVGAICAGADARQVASLATFGRVLGTAQQQLEDLGNLLPRSGATRHEDLIRGRLTWPWAWAAQSLPVWHLDQLGRRAHDIVQSHGADRLEVARLADHLLAVVGQHQRQHVSTLLYRALFDLRATFGSTPTLLALRNEIDQLERSFG